MIGEQMDWTLTSEGFTLSKPHLYRGWYNYLCNPDYGIKISHLGDAFSTTLQEPRLVVTNYDFFNQSKGRFLYIQENKNQPWSPSYYPAATELDDYTCTHSPGYSKFSSCKNDLSVTHTVFLPLNGTYEINLIELENRGTKRKNLKSTFIAEPLLYDSFAVDPVYYSWFTNSEFDKNNNALVFKKLHGNPVTGFLSSIPAPDSWEASLTGFTGNGDLRRPESLKKEKLRSVPSGGDPYGGIFQFRDALEPGEKKKMVIFLGIGNKTNDLINKKYKRISQVENELGSVKQFWKNKLHKKEIDHLPEEIFKEYCTSFFPYQIFQQSEGLVRSNFRGFRDVAQDAIGLSYYDWVGSRQIILQMCQHQHKNGRCLRQWSTSGGVHDERDFRDLPFWIPLALHYYIKNSGDIEILNKLEPYIDGETATVYDHMITGLKYALKFNDQNLLEMGEGDWNDALSGMGEKGGSVWLNQIAYYSLELLEEMSDKVGKTITFDISKIKEQLFQGVMEQWNGKWFNRGITDKGFIIGETDRIFLLPQAWFIISGMAKRDPQKGDAALKAMVEHLDNKNGLQLCSPGFDGFDENVGNLSALAPGLAENYAVYNHASAFGIYALFKAGDSKNALRFLKKLLPFYKDYHQTKSEPFVLVNYYNGGYYPEKEGEGGIPWLTSTVSWLAVILFEEMIPTGLFPS